MKIAGYLKTSLLDWPGKVSSVIFTVGCNFRCPFCHNKDLVTGESLIEIAEEDILADLPKRKKWIDGLVITGGEPTTQKDLAGFCTKVKNLGLGIKLDTNGSHPEIVDNLLKRNLIDMCAMDIKTDKDAYADLVGTEIDIKKVEKTLRLILQSKIAFELRTTLVPGIHKLENVIKAGRWLSELFARFGIKSKHRIWVWQNFVGRNCFDSRLDGKKGYSIGVIKRMKKEINKLEIEIRLRGWQD